MISQGAPFQLFVVQIDGQDVPQPIRRGHAFLAGFGKTRLIGRFHDNRAGGCVSRRRSNDLPYSTMLWPSTYPKSARPCRNASKRGKERPCGARNPTRRILAVCCASEGKSKKVSARMTTVTTRVDTGISFREQKLDLRQQEKAWYCLR
jgi:hypothetical protein